MKTCTHGTEKAPVDKASDVNCCGTCKDWFLPIAIGNTIVDLAPTVMGSDWREDFVRRSAERKAENEARLAADKAKRELHPSVLSGRIRERLSYIMKRNSGMSDREVANTEDAIRITELLDTLETVLLTDALTASLEARKS